jgi:hypothetical protein
VLLCLRPIFGNVVVKGNFLTHNKQDKLKYNNTVLCDQINQTTVSRITRSFHKLVTDLQDLVQPILLSADLTYHTAVRN